MASTRIRFAMRLVPALTLIASIAQAAVGPGVCVQTLIQIQDAAHGMWLKGLLPARVIGSRGRNDVILIQRKNGSYVMNEGAQLYPFPIESLSFQPSQLLRDKKTGSVAGNFDLWNTEAARLMTPQGSEITLHRLRVDKTEALVLRGSQDDQAQLASVAESLEIKKEALKDLIAKREETLKVICGQISGSSGSANTLTDVLAKPLKSMMSSDNLPAKKSWTEKKIAGFKANEAAREKDANTIQSLIRDAQSTAASTPTKFSQKPLSSADMRSVLDEVVPDFIESMKNTALSKTDRDEIKAYCGDTVKLPDSIMRASDSAKAKACENMLPQQKEICLVLMNKEPSTSREAK